MRVLVTGAQGCIGAWVVKGLLERGIDVLVFDLEANAARLGLIAPAELQKSLRVEIGGIEDTTRVKALIKDQSITHVVHLAALLMPACQANPVLGGMVNVIGTLNLFEGAQNAGRPVRVVYASSSAVWGPEEMYGNQFLDESQPIEPASHYGVFKHANEGSARVFYKTNGISSIGLRPWTVYGVGRDNGLTADPTLAMKALVLGLPFQIRLSGYMDLQYVEDVAQTFIHCLLSPLEGAHVFNMAGEVVRMDELITTLDGLRPGAAKTITFAGPQVPVAFRMDATRLHTMVPGIPRTPLAEGMRRTLDIYERLKAEGRLQSTGIPTP